MLVDCVAQPLYLTCQEGLRFLVFLFSISREFVVLLNKRIKSAVPGCSKKVAEGMGDVYLKAWSASVGESKEEIEKCIQVGRETLDRWNA